MLPKWPLEPHCALSECPLFRGLLQREPPSSFRFIQKGPHRAKLFGEHLDHPRESIRVTLRGENCLAAYLGFPAQRSQQFNDLAGTFRSERGNGGASIHELPVAQNL